MPVTSYTVYTWVVSISQCVPRDHAGSDRNPNEGEWAPGTVTDPYVKYILLTGISRFYVDPTHNPQGGRVAEVGGIHS
jgi:hypothetical protein